MRINRLIAYFVVFIGIFVFTNKASACYSPTLGRWIEEDPAGYKDGDNLYQYLRGKSVVLTDPTGLCSCGPDITLNLLRIRQNIRHVFSNYNDQQMDDFYDGFYDFANAANSWDITSLSSQIVSSTQCPKNNCAGYNINTVTVEGKCYAQEEVNYWLLGVTARAIYDYKGSFDDSSDDVLDSLLYRIYLWRTYGPKTGGIPGRQAWTVAGYVGDVTLAGDSSGLTAQTEGLSNQVTQSAAITGCPACKEGPYSGKLTYSAGVGPTRIFGAQ